MATTVTCDVCGAPMGLGRIRLRVTGEPHPHTGEAIRGGSKIDVCGKCLEGVDDLHTDLSLHELKVARVSRTTSYGGGEKRPTEHTEGTEEEAVAFLMRTLQGDEVVLKAPDGDCATDGCVFEAWERRGSLRFRVSSPKCLRCGFQQLEVLA